MLLADRYPECADDLTLEIGFGMKIAHEVYDIQARGRIEAQRVRDERDDGGDLRRGRLRARVDEPRRRVRLRGSAARPS